MKPENDYSTFNVIKIGGSIIRDPSALKALLSKINKLALAGHKFIIVPGGGVLADEIRLLQSSYRVSDKAAHWMAIACMDINAILLQSHLSLSLFLSEDLKKLDNQIYILQSSSFENIKNLPESWDMEIAVEKSPT